MFDRPERRGVFDTLTLRFWGQVLKDGWMDLRLPTRRGGKEVPTGLFQCGRENKGPGLQRK